MKPNAKLNTIILALKRAIEATFDDGKWRELGYLTDTIDIIEGHSRLLRSLDWRDDDYSANILNVLPEILGKNLENREVVEDFVGLEEWLRSHEPQLHEKLYGGTSVPLEEIEKAAGVHSVLELNQQIGRIRHSIHDDPALAVGSAKELLETVMRTILGEDDDGTKTDDVPALLKRVQRALGLSPQAASPDMVGSEVLCRTLSNLGQVVIGVAELRNLVGTGHGRSKGPEIDDVHARLVVNAAATIATYLLEIWENQRKT